MQQEALNCMPKRPQNGYMTFRSDVFDDIKKRNQEKSLTELTQLISQMWTDLDEKKKNKYQSEYEKALQQYKSDYQVWLKKFKLEEEQVKQWLKDKKDQNKKNKRGSKKVTKASKDSEDEDEQRIQELKKQNQQVKEKK